MKCSKTDGMLCLRDDLPLTKIMLCFLFVVFNNIASLNTFGSELTPNEEESLQNVQTCRIMFRLSLFVVLIQTSHPTTDLWLEETYCGVFSNVFHKTTQSQRANFCPQLHPCRSSKVYKFAHVQRRGLQKILHDAFQFVMFENTNYLLQTCLTCYCKRPINKI